ADPVMNPLPYGVRDVYRFRPLCKHLRIDQPSVDQRERELVVLLPAGDQLRHNAVMRIEEVSTTRRSASRLDKYQPITPALRQHSCRDTDALSVVTERLVERRE